MTVLHDAYLIGHCKEKLGRTNHEESASNDVHGFNTMEHTR